MGRTHQARVLTAKNGRRGVETFEAHASEITAVLLDLTMPDLSGEDVFRMIPTIRPDVKVILSSGYNAQESVNWWSKARSARRAK